MGDSVKRTYRSALREAQARDTRRAVVATATHLFVERGYGATTVDAVAAGAGVSRKTVFATVGGKLDLLRTALDWAVAGGEDRAPVAEQELRPALAAEDPVEVLHGCARAIGRINARAAGLVGALDAAAGADEKARELAEEGQRARLGDARTIVDRLHALGALTPDLTRDEAVDLVWLATDPGLFDRLVRRRGWSSDRFEHWLGGSLAGALLRR
jgi:AcrR family transcriptional regulator